MAEEGRTPEPLDSPDDIRSLERYYVVGLTCMLFLILAFPLYRIGEPERRARAGAALHAENVLQGENLFALHCASCHGDAGLDASTGVAVGSEEYLAETTDPQLTWFIAGGVPGTPMAAYHVDLGGPFADHEVDWIVAYLRSLEVASDEEPSLADAEEEPSELEAVEARPLDDPESAPASQVAEAYARHCALCHGAEGEGGPLGPPVRPLAPHFRADPDSAFALTAFGVPGTSMMGYLDTEGGPLDAELIRAMLKWFLAADPD